MKVLLTDGVDDDARRMLEAAGLEVDVMPTMTEDELSFVISEYDAVMIRSATKMTARLIHAGGRLKIIGRAGVGVDNIDMAAARKRGIAVVNSPSGNSNAVAEHTVALMLSLARHVHRAHAHVVQGGWDKKQYKGIELRGKTLGVVGLGKIGRLVSAAAIGLGMEVVGFDPFVDEAGAKAIGVRKASLEELLPTSDFITVHVPLTAGTRNLISKREFSVMKDGVRVLNVARGGIIDEGALYDAIMSGKVAGAALDVWQSEPPKESKLLGLDQVLATPHLGGNTREAQKNVAVDVARNISMFFADGKTEPQCRVA